MTSPITLSPIWDMWVSGCAFGIAVSVIGACLKYFFSKRKMLLEIRILYAEEIARVLEATLRDGDALPALYVAIAKLSPYKKRLGKNGDRIFVHLADAAEAIQNRTGTPSVSLLQAIRIVCNEK